MNDMLTITTLGGLSIRRGDEPVTGFASRKVEALLVYLACTGRPQPREVVAEMLWEERSQSQALANLRVVLSSLRKHLTPYVTITRDTVALDPDAAVWLDAAELEHKLSAGQVEEAVALYRGDFLAGFYVRDAPGFEDWAAIERERLRQLVLGALNDLVAYHLDVGDYAAGIRHASRLLELDPLLEQAHRQMMRLLAYSGQRGAALEQYETCRHLLQRELAVEPMPETTDLYEQIQAGTLEPPAIGGEAAKEIPPAPGEPPFKGLQYFDVADADLFFGRELLTARLIERLRHTLFLHTVGEGEDRFLAIVGTSGSGKSSLVRAGLVAALQRGAPLADDQRPPEGSTHWPVHIITPTAHPLESLAVSLTRDAESTSAAATLMDDLARDPRSLHLHVRKTLDGDNRLLLVVDQFEELFTQCRDPIQRRAFVDNLLTAASTAGPILVVIALRADFYHHCAQFERLRDALEKYQAYIGPMTSEELHCAIEGPAHAGGWDFQRGLVDLLLRDVGDEPGALPLLSHALLETWKRRRGHTLTLGGYAEAGGVRGAIAETAETVYQRLDERQQTIARNIFLRLTELGEGTEDTRRRATLHELFPRPEEATAVEAVLSTLADARLVTTEKETVQVAHEALIREWPTLREWLEEDREGLRVHRHLTEAAREWERMERDSGELYRGARLAQASEWASEHPEALNPLEREFLAASEEWAQRREAELEAQRQRELEAAQRLAEERARSTARLRRRAVWLALALVVALIAAVVAGAFGSRATAERTVALTAQAQEAAQRAVAQTAEALEADQRMVAETAQAEEAAQRVVAETAQAQEAVQSALAVERREEALVQASIGLGSQALLELDGFFPERSVLLALEALEHYPYTWQAERALGQAVLGSRLRLILQHKAEVSSIWWSSDGIQILTASEDGTAKVRDANTGEGLVTLVGHEDWVVMATWSPSEERILTASKDGTAKVWNATTGEELLTLSHEPWVNMAIWSSLGEQILTASDDFTAKVWDANTGELLLTLSGHEDWVAVAAWSPSEERILTSSADDTVRVWDANTGEELLVLSGHQDLAVWDSKWSPDGSRIAAAGDDMVKVWDASTGVEILTFSKHPVSRPVWSPSGDRIATAGFSEGTAQVWDASASSPTYGEELFTLAGHSDVIYHLVWSSDGSRIATASQDGRVIVWDAATGTEIVTLFGHAGAVTEVAWSPLDDRILSAGDDGTAKVWDPDPTLLTITNLEDSEGLVAWSPGGDCVAATSSYGTAKVWDAVTGEELFVLSGTESTVAPFPGWSPSGDRLLTINLWGASPDTPSARVWDASASSPTYGEELVALFGHSGRVFGGAWSPDGTRIVTGGADDDTARVWDASASSPTYGAELLTLTGHSDGIADAKWSPDGKTIATGGFDGTVKIWDAATGEVVRDLYPGGLGFPVTAVAWSSDGKRIATHSRDGIGRIFDTTTGEELVTFTGHTSDVWSMFWSRTSERILTGGDTTARVWDTTTGSELLRYDLGHFADVALSPDDTRIVTGGYDAPLRVFPTWQTLEELIDYAKECCVVRELTAEERELFGLPLR